MSPQPAKPKKPVKPDQRAQTHFQVATVTLDDGSSLECSARIDKSGLWVHTTGGYANGAAVAFPTRRVSNVVWTPDEPEVEEPPGGEPPA